MYWRATDQFDQSVAAPPRHDHTSHIEAAIDHEQTTQAESQATAESDSSAASNQLCRPYVNTGHVDPEQKQHPPASSPSNGQPVGAKQLLAHSPQKTELENTIDQSAIAQFTQCQHSNNI
jgi:hypothetical protein